MQRIVFLVAAFCAALSVAAPARAFTPESGWWWNPQEPGSGVQIEIQDNFLALSAYAYTTSGPATWFTAQGLMTGNSRFSGQLDAFSGGQCIGCAYRAPSPSLGAGGPIAIEFLTETTANLTWGNRTMRIERFDFYLTRGAADPKTELMLGEWQIVIDFYDRDDSFERFPYFGEVLAIETLDVTRSPDQFKGCRPRTSLRPGRCTTTEIRNHDVAGFYDAAEGEHVILVTDVQDDDTDDLVFFAYYAKTGTYQFDGVMEVCGFNRCGLANARYYPVRGFRSASRNFVQNGAGPSSSDKAAPRATGSLARQIADANGGVMPAGLTREEVHAQFGIDPTVHADELAALQATRAAR